MARRRTVSRRRASSARESNAARRIQAKAQPRSRSGKSQKQRKGRWSPASLLTLWRRGREAIRTAALTVASTAQRVLFAARPGPARTACGRPAGARRAGGRRRLGDGLSVGVVRELAGQVADAIERG